MKKFTVVLFIFGCSGAEIAIAPSLPNDARVGTLRIVAEDKSGQKYLNLEILKFSLSKIPLKSDQVENDTVSNQIIPVGVKGISIPMLEGSYTGNLRIRENSDASDRVSIRALFNENSTIGCKMNFIDDGWSLYDELSCGAVKIIANKETILRIIITDRYDSRFAGSFFFALFTLGLIYPPAEIRHVDASIINPK
ncbi:hypothetical protein [Leptospira neocaledonica]|uniref:Uncharacterized protein n=1 Tax=Leptospira neocaledonica TaxID=2023192 RepID=A0A2M9ZZE3_9LEPT|nr:hypothetical protein [Leptospira neocaledonica]PJZ77408.1 hypothetical protein CH365_07410 [Leptospira neocaledonica]